MDGQYQRQNSYMRDVPQSMAISISPLEFNLLVYDKIASGLQTIVQKTSSIARTAKDYLVTTEVTDFLNSAKYYLVYSKGKSEGKKKSKRERLDNDKAKKEKQMKNPSGNSRFANKQKEGTFVHPGQVSKKDPSSKRPQMDDPLTRWVGRPYL